MIYAKLPIYGYLQYRMIWREFHFFGSHGCLQKVRAFSHLKYSTPTSL